jgi:hydrogenase maturation protease
MLAKSLVIGYGNSLRGDDGIGREVAEIVASWNLPQVRSLSRFQLTPELAADLAEVEMVIFVDACQVAKTDTVKLYDLQPLADIQIRSHFSSPQTILNLTQTLYGKCPQAWWLVIPGVDFHFSDRLSATAKQNISLALTQIKNLVSESSCTKSASCKTL